MSKLENRVALVTGASRGIGAAVAIGLAQAGADIVVNYHSRTGEAERVCAEIRNLGRRALCVRADVAQSVEVNGMVAQIQNELGGINILVNNAGIARRQKIEETRESDWDEIISVNLKSAFLVSQAVLPAMRAARWGRIINISSVAAQLGGLIGPHYAASKAGMLGLTHSYASLLIKEGITVNSIAPALIETEMVTSNPNAKPDIIPMGRFGSCGEVADIVVMLATNGYITGQTLNVNGGWYMS